MAVTFIGESRSYGSPTPSVGTGSRRPEMPKRAIYAQSEREMGWLEPNLKISSTHSPDYVGDVVIDDVPYHVTMWNEPKEKKCLRFQRMGDA